MDLVTIDDIREAAGRINGVAVRTPLLRMGEAWLKPESLQPVGSFKIRGAYNAVASLRPAGVVTHSSGNHGQALAYAAAESGVPCVVVVPEGTPAVKAAAIEGWGAELVVVPPDQREVVAGRLARERGLTLVPPYDHRAVIAGQGTIGLEIVEDLPDVEAVLVPVSGGGLASGVAAAVKALRPDVRVYGVEPELAADAAESLAAGHVVAWETSRTYRTVADGLRVNRLSELTFAHLREHLEGIVTVSEDEMLAAVRHLARTARLVAEPSGAATTAALLSGRVPAGRTVAVLSGGNVDPELFARAYA
ncbi:MAG: threonine/serine dehydratase [Nonomuraea sp.]|nr:threonine/serine dehydratase [Nonomuraea sp.]NUP69007.1 threonine/serine dehydratase [Nonomuraea sp.]NUP81556.1 threonine/serine dehydratase [Nonomuraea sp.]NUS02203.1 threonine/serine dehydratase [Nonomuraea sp.]NUT45609.1 threonine/serine dehydratase [Thermoactinospora sp.]